MKDWDWGWNPLSRKPPGSPILSAVAGSAVRSRPLPPTPSFHGAVSIAASFEKCLFHFLGMVLLSGKRKESVSGPVVKQWKREHTRARLGQKVIGWVPPLLTD